MALFNSVTAVSLDTPCRISWLHLSVTLHCELHLICTHPTRHRSSTYKQITLIVHREGLLPIMPRSHILSSRILLHVPPVAWEGCPSSAPLLLPKRSSPVHSERANGGDSAIIQLLPLQLDWTLRLKCRQQRDRGGARSQTHRATDYITCAFLFLTKSFRQITWGKVVAVGRSSRLHGEEPVPWWWPTHISSFPEVNTLWTVFPELLLTFQSSVPPSYIHIC